MIQNSQDIAKEFNKIFSSVGSKLVNIIPNNEKKIKGFLASHDEKSTLRN